MHSPQWVAAILVAATISGCGEGAASPSAQPEPEPLLAALALTPMGARAIHYTDWDGLKQAIGVEVTSSDALEERVRFIEQVAGGMQPETAFSAFGIEMFSGGGLATYWGFDSTDLSWEATIEVAGGRAFLLSFRDGSHLSTLDKLFDDRGYAVWEAAGLRLRTHAMAGDEWLLGSNLAMLNAVLLPDGQTVILSASEPVARQFFTGPMSALASPIGDDLGRLVAALEHPTGAWISIALTPDDYCHPVPRILRPEILDAEKKALTNAGTLHRYEAFAIAYRSALDPVGRIAFVYSAAADAQADVAGRLLLAAGPSLQRPDASLADMFFTVADAAADGNVLVLRASPLGDAPAMLYKAAISQDFIFAACDTGF